MTIHQQADHIADLLRTAMKSDSTAPSVLSSTLHDILRDDLGWTSAEETREICDERDSLAEENEKLRSELDENQ